MGSSPDKGETVNAIPCLGLGKGRGLQNARFYSLGETLKGGNVLEIEFKTE